MLQLDEYVDSAGRVPFATWLKGLRNVQARARITKRLTRLRAGLWGDSKAVGAGVVELREDYGPGYRVYVGRHCEQLVVLLAGGNKATQAKDIDHAKSNWKDWQDRTRG